MRICNRFSAAFVSAINPKKTASAFCVVFSLALVIDSLVAPVSRSGVDAQMPGGDPTASARAFVARLGRDAVEKLPARHLKRAQARSQFQKIIRENFDVAGIGRRVFAEEWGPATPAQRTEALRLYTEWVTDGLMNLLSRHSGERFRLLPASATVPIAGGFRIGAEIRRPNGERVRVDWFLRSAAGSWRVTNLRTPDGGDLVATHREEFRSIIEQAPAGAESFGLEYIIEELRIRTAPL